MSLAPLRRPLGGLRHARPGGGARPTRAPLVAVLALLTSFVGGLATSTPAGAVEPAGPRPAAFVLVDADRGRVLAGDRIHEQFRPASVAKVMTALVALEALPPDAEVPVSAVAAAQPASRISMVEGQVWSFRDALASLVMVSANDAAYAIAERAGGSLDGFATMLQEAARRFGMRDSVVNDPAGFDDTTSVQGGPLMSPFDIAITARNALTVPELMTLAGTDEQAFVDPAGRDRNLVNHNKMLPANSRAYPWATGLKPGYTKQAGQTLVATATKDGRTLIAVVLGVYDTYGWAAHLFETAFAAGPNAPGTGEQLPSPQIRPYGTPAPTSSTATTDTSDGAGRAAGGGRGETTVAADAATPRGDDGGEAAVVAAGGAGSGDDGLWPPSLLVIAVAGLAVVGLLVALRRRAVRRRRARRIARRRATEEAMRRGGLPVVDGRYRTGTRVGPPIDSEVQVRGPRAPEPGARS